MSGKAERDCRFISYIVLALSSLLVSYLYSPAVPSGLSRPSLKAEAPASAPVTPPEAAHNAPAKDGKPAPGMNFPGFPVNINKATLDELKMLPGIGEKTARRILEKREALGGFTSVDELEEVKWIGPAKLSKIRGLVTVDGDRPGAGKGPL